jgi:hypothetical protein
MTSRTLAKTSTQYDTFSPRPSWLGRTLFEGKEVTWVADAV